MNRRCFGFSCIFLLAACGSSAVDSVNVGTSDERAIVSREDANTAFEIVKKIDYLPFGYTADGCYARALYMSMEIAAQGIPTSAEYIFATDNATLSPGNGIEWDWHVAPMLQIGRDGTPTIIDPALFSAPLIDRSLDTWVHAVNPVPAGGYKTILVPGSSYDQERLNDTRLIASYAELPPFQVPDIDNACSTAWDYLALESPQLSPDDLATKRSKLIARSYALMPELQTRGKLTGDPSSFTCEGRASNANGAAVAGAPDAETSDASSAN